VATVTVTLPAQARLVGAFPGAQVIGDAIRWQGEVAAGSEIPLPYQLLLGSKGAYWLIHRAQVEDQHGERWLVEARTEVALHKTYMPIIPR
jgi:hypothetical protein